MVLGFVALLHGKKTMGIEKTLLFFESAMIFSGFEETYWILSGRFGTTKIYYFAHGGLWFFEIPVYTYIAWYLICYCGYMIVKYLFPRLRTAGVAAMVAAFGTCWDIWLDLSVCNQHLVSSIPDMWIWFDAPGISLFGIPILNFAGWFGVIFMIVYVFDKKLRSEEQLSKKSVGHYFLYLAICWDILFLALHGVGAIQMLATINIFPMVFGSVVNPVTAGTGSITAVFTLIYIGVLIAGAIIAVVFFVKGKVEKGLQIIPVILIGWWLNGGISTLAQILVVYPGANLALLAIVFSIYPSLLAILSVLPSKLFPGNRKSATAKAP